MDKLEISKILRNTISELYVSVEDSVMEYSPG